MRAATNFKNNVFFRCAAVGLSVLYTCALSIESHAQVAREDSIALVNIYNSLNGENWVFQRNWLVGPVGNWEGVGIENGRVVVLDLSQNEISGNIPLAIFDLTQLRALSLAGNSIGGILHPSIGRLKQLRILELHQNRIVGSIPPEIKELTELRSLTLAANDMSGPIPPEMGELTSLQTLDLFRNNFTGDFPVALTRLSTLKRLFLSYNAFSGSIPVDVKNMTGLELLRIERNTFSGTIPPELAELSSLRVLDLSGNQLTGMLPFEFGRLKKLEVLWLFNNALNGDIPESWGDMESLITLQLLNNPLSGSLPASLTRLTKLKRLGLVNTGICIPGDPDMQMWLNELPNFSTSGIDCIATSAHDHTEPPDRLEVVALYPNPTISSATLRIGMPISADVSISTFDILGREVLPRKTAALNAGWHQFILDVSTLPPATYLIRLQAGRQLSTAFLTVTLRI